MAFTLSPYSKWKQCFSTFASLERNYNRRFDLGEDSLGGKKFFHKLKSAYVSGRKTFFFFFSSPGPMINLVEWDEVCLVF